VHTCNLICLQPVNTGPSHDDDIVAAVTAPAEPASAAPSYEEEEEGDLTSLDLPGRPQAMEVLDTLQRYLLGIRNSDRAQMSFDCTGFGGPILCGPARPGPRDFRPSPARPVLFYKIWSPARPGPGPARPGSARGPPGPCRVLIPIARSATPIQ